MNKHEDLEDSMESSDLEDLSPKPPKAYRNRDYLNSSHARPIRMLCELMEPAARLRAQRVENSIVFFGSARNPDPERAARMLKDIDSNLRGPNLSEEATRQLNIRKRQIELATHYYEEARKLSHRLTKWSLEMEDKKQKFYICSGGGPGIMEAANRGAREAGGRSIALGISLPFEQKLNPYCDDELSFDFHYFFLRKYWFLYHARALVVFPGGFGTMDELFEMLTLVQTHKTVKPIRFILYGREFWDAAVNFSTLVEWGTISPEDIGLFELVDTVDEAFELLQQIKLSRF